jgi:hypothetical protein
MDRPRVDPCEIRVPTVLFEPVFGSVWMVSFQFDKTSILDRWYWFDDRNGLVSFRLLDRCIIVPMDRAGLVLVRSIG